MKHSLMGTPKGVPIFFINDVREVQIQKYSVSSSLVYERNAASASSSVVV